MREHNEHARAGHVCGCLPVQAARNTSPCFLFFAVRVHLRTSAASVHCRLHFQGLCIGIFVYLPFHPTLIALVSSPSFAPPFPLSLFPPSVHLQIRMPRTAYSQGHTTCACPHTPLWLLLYPLVLRQTRFGMMIVLFISTHLDMSAGEGEAAAGSCVGSGGRGGYLGISFKVINPWRWRKFLRMFRTFATIREMRIQ